MPTGEELNGRLGPSGSNPNLNASPASAAHPDDGHAKPPLHKKPDSFGSMTSLSSWAVPGGELADGTTAMPPQRRRLPSYVSEPPSTLLALSMIAQEEERAAAAAAAAADGNLSPPGGSGTFPTAINSPFESTSAEKADTARQETSWMHGNPNVGRGPQAHSNAGDLAGTELRQRRVNFAEATQSPKLSPRKAQPVHDKQPWEVLRKVNRVHRRDADMLFQDNHSDDDEVPAATPRKDQGSLGFNHGHELNESILGLDEHALKPKRRLYQHRRFWVYVILLAISLSFAAAGVCLIVFAEEQLISEIQVWRLCFFITGLPIIWVIGDAVSSIIVYFVEKRMFTIKNALYFAYAVRKPLRWVVRAVLTTIWWPLIMIVAGKESESVTNAYKIILRVLICVSLFFLANLLKTLIAKILSLKFNKTSHMAKMYSTLQKEQWLHKLLKPRQPYASGDDDEDGGGGGFGMLDTRFSVPNLLSKMKIGKSHSAEAELERGVSSSGRNGKDSLRFWRRRSEPLPPVEEQDEGSDGVEMTKMQQGEGSGGGEAPLKITIDPGLPESPPKQHRRAASQPPPVRVEPPSDGGLPSVFDVQRSPLPHPAAISAANAAASGAAVSPSKTAGMTTPKTSASQGGPPSLNRISTGMRSTDDDVGPGLSGKGLTFDGPLRRDEVMNRLAKLERYIRKNELETTFRDTLNKADPEDVRDAEGKRVGAFLFWNVKSNFDKSYIEPEDMQPFLSEEEVHPAFDMFDVNGNGKVTVEECVTAVQGIFQERRNLASSLKDTRNIASSLETMIGAVIHLIFAMIYCIILLQTSFKDIWAFVTTVVLGLSFVFGPYVRTIFENVMFLFSSHPFDVGDMLYLDSDFLTVDEITINFTVFLNSNKQRVWYPNQKLVTNPFINMTNSGNKGEGIKILVDLDTPPTILDDICAAVGKLQAEMPQEIGSYSAHFRDASVPMKMTLAVYFDYTHSGTNLGRCSRVRTQVHIVVARVLNQAGVTYTWPTLRSINLPPGQAQGGVAVVADPAVLPQMGT